MRRWRGWKRTFSVWGEESVNGGVSKNRIFLLKVNNSTWLSSGFRFTWSCSSGSFLKKWSHLRTISLIRMICPETALQRGSWRKCQLSSEEDLSSTQGAPVDGLKSFSTYVCSDCRSLGRYSWPMASSTNNNLFISWFL